MTQAHAHKELEIETAYLARYIPAELRSISPTRITDIYLSPASNMLTKIRLRQKGSSYELTKKVNIDPNDLSLQDEFNIPLSKTEFELFSQIGGRTVSKDRYKLPYNGHTLEVDVFLDGLAGFVLIECEFASISNRDSFVAPDFCGADVTQEDFIAGIYLAGKTYADIEKDLTEYSYTALYL